jgi:hypothetical protein
MFSCSQTRIACAIVMMSAAPLGVLGAQQLLPPCDASVIAPLQETVIDRQTRVPLRDALIVINWLEAGTARQVSARTDSMGRALLCLPAAQEAEIRVTYGNVQSAPVPFTTSSTQTHMTRLDVPGVAVRGQVVDESTNAPVANAAVRLVHTSVNVMTGPDGRFMVPRIPLGGHELRVEHVLYAPTSTRLNAEGADLVATLRLTATAIPLAPVTVVGVSRRLDQAGFYEREKRGVGSFISRAQIDAARVQFASDLLRGVPGVRLISSAGRRGAPRSFTTGRGSCRFRYVVDGTRVLADFELENLPISHIEGIEVYAGMAQVPAVFRAMTDATGSTCGVIAVWMRDGR